MPWCANPVLPGAVQTQLHQLTREPWLQVALPEPAREPEAGDVAAKAATAGTGSGPAAWAVRLAKQLPRNPPKENRRSDWRHFRIPLRYVALRPRGGAVTSRCA